MKTLKSEDAAWLAGLANGDGYWYFKKRIKITSAGNKCIVFSFGLTIGLKDKAIIDKCLQIVGEGWLQDKDGFYIWNVGKTVLKWLIPQLKPYAVKGALEIIEQAMPLTGYSHIHIKGQHGGSYRQPKVTETLLSLHKEWQSLRVRV